MQTERVRWQLPEETEVMPPIQSGDTIRIVAADGQTYVTTALSGVETTGHSFPVVWVARPLARGGTDRVPWPADAVSPLRGAGGESRS
jgi:hypothetical protein